MEQAPKWFRPVAIVALLWNLLGCAAYLADAMISPEAVAQMTAAQQALYNSRPAWSVGATAIAVWFGALGSLALVIKKGWATPVLILSLVGVVAQDVWLFALSDAAAETNAVALVLQGLVLAISVALVMLSRKAAARGWIT